MGNLAVRIRKLFLKSSYLKKEAFSTPDSNTET